MKRSIPCPWFSLGVSRLSGLGAACALLMMIAGCGSSSDDPPPPDTTVPAPATVTTAPTGSTSDNTPTLSGTAEPNATITIMNGATSVGTTTADSTTGSWSVTTSVLTDGTYTLGVTATDVAGNTSTATSVGPFTVDTATPAAPVITSPADGDAVNTATPALSGTAEANSTVEVFVDAASNGTATADGAGNWSYTTTTLAESAHAFTATATDAASNTSVASSPAVTVTVDITAPAAPVITSPADGDAVNTATPALSGTAEANSTVEVFVDAASNGTATADGAGNWSYTTTTLAESAHAFTATATDAASNTSVASSPAVTVTVDITNPVVTVDTLVTNSATPQVSGTVSDSGSGVASVDVTVNAVNYTGTVIGSNWTADVTTTLTEGTYDVAATATDNAGNTDSDATTDELTVDLTAPTTLAAPTDPGAYTNSTTTVTFTWSVATDTLSGVASYVLQVGTTPGGTDVLDMNVGSVITYDVDITGVIEGQTIYASVAAVDVAGNQATFSPDSDGIMKDTTAPVVTVDTLVTNSTTPQVSGTVSDSGSGVASVDVTVNAVNYTGTVIGGTWTANVITPLADGLWDVAATATDNAGNVVSDGTIDELTVDTATGPGIPGTPTDAGVYSTSLIVTFNWTLGANAASYYLQVGTTPGAADVFDADLVSVLTNYTVTGVDGQTLYARVATINAASQQGEWSGVSDGIMIDVTLPIVTVDTLVTNSTTPQVSGTVNESGSGVASVDVTVNAVLYTGTVIGSSWTANVTTPLPEGAYDVATTATDNASNAGSDATTNELTVDLTAPTTLAAPTDPGVYTNSTTTVTIDWSVATDPVSGGVSSGVASYVLQVGTTPGGTDVLDMDVGNVTTYDVDITGVTEAQTIYASVAAVDAAGNQAAFSPSSDGIIKDTTAPAAPAITSPVTASATNSTLVALAGTAEANSTVEVFVDAASNGTATADGAGNWSYTTSALTESAHAFTATATDAAGNSSVASSPAVTVTVDLTAPAPPLITYPAPSDATNLQPTITGTAEPDALVDVYIDGSWEGTATAEGAGDWSFPTPAPLASGGHTVDAEATDAAGNTGALSVAVSFNSYQAPTVTGTQPDSTSPPNWVSPSTTIDVWFDQAMDPASVEAAFALKDSANQEPANGYVFSWNATDDQLTIIPDTGNPADVSNNDILVDGETYTIEITTGAMSALGVPMSAVFTEPFTVGDFSPPMLVSALVGAAPSTNLLTDAADAADVAGDDTITFVFDEDIRDITLTGTQVEFREAGGGGARLSFSPFGGGEGTLSWSAGQPDQFVLTFDTWVSLRPGAEYSVNFWGVNDVSNNNIGWESSRFQIQVLQSPSADTAAPTVISTIPAASETGVDGRAMVIISFSEPVLSGTLSGISITGTGVTTADFYLEYSDDDVDGSPAAFFMPKKALPAGVVITVDLPITITDLATNALANPGSFTFTVDAAAAETGAPIIDETTPPAGSVVGNNTWMISVSFKDAITGLPESLDVTTVDDADIRVTNNDTGMISRGWRVQTDAGSNVLSADSPPGGPGLDVGRISIVDISGDGATTVTVTTSGDHGLIVGDIVRITNTANFNADGMTIATVPATDQFTYTVAAAPAVTNTWGDVEYAITYTVEVGTNTLTDAVGNVMTPASFTFTVAPDGINRDSILQRLDYEVAGSTGPGGRDLWGRRIELADADGDMVTITVTGPGLTGGTAITGTIDTSTQTWWEFGSEGPPGAARPGMDDTNYPTSGLYTFTIALDDSMGGTSSYSKDAWVWRPDEVPAVSSIDGTSVVGQMTPLLVTNPTPTFVWTNVDTTNADSLVLIVADMGVFSGDEGGLFFPSLLHPATTSLAFPAGNPLPVGTYLWAIVQMKLLAGEEIGEGWSLDMGAKMVESQFVYGPSNATLTVTDAYGFASSEVQFDSYSSPPTFIGTRGLTGLGTFDGTVSFDYSGTYNDGTPVPGGALKYYAYDSITQDLSLTDAMSFAVERGFLARAGDLMVSVQKAESVVGISAGARRFATAGFSAASLTGTYGFFAIETYQNPFGAGASVGEATFDGAGNVTMTGTLNDGSPFAGAAPYTVAADGLVSLSINIAPVITAKGYIGGAAGSEILVLNVDDAADHSVFWILTKNHDLTGNTVADLTGQYRWVVFEVSMNAGVFDRPYSDQGTATFDGAGMADFVTGSWTGTVPYTVNAAGNRVVLGTLELVAGPDLDTLIGIQVSDADWVEIYIFSK